MINNLAIIAKYISFMILNRLDLFSEMMNPIQMRYPEFAVGDNQIFHLSKETIILSDLSKSRMGIVKMQGNAMLEAHIPDGAYVEVDSSIRPANQQFVLAKVNNDWMIRRYIKNSSGARLMPANEKFQPIPITGTDDIFIWGTVTKIIIHTLPID
ncbi:MAG: response UmuD protein Serine peptidase family [Bacteroidota bacterium]|jgi:hypothetical protein